MFIDTHCHIYKEYYEDIAMILDKARDKGIEKIINNGCDTKSNKEVLELISKYPNMYGAIGIHPENVDNYTLEDIKLLEDNINNPKIVAIGEIGLDYHYSKDNKEKQIELLKLQLALAEKYHKSVIIHSREATEDTIKTLKEYKVTGVIHAFSGSIETAKIYLKMGYFLGVGGVLTFKNSKLKEVIKEVPLERIVLETDSPYLTPEPNRGKRNEPAYVFDIALYLSEIKNVKISQVSIITNKNVQEIFDI